MPSRNYLVTGGSGFLGSALVKSLVHQGHRVRVFDDNSRGAMRRLEQVEGDYEFVNGDIRDLEAVRHACHGIESVCHLAYINGTEFFYSKPALVLEVGVKGMLNVLDGCLSEGVPELLLMSSSEVYQTPPTLPTPETVPLVVPDPLQARYSYGGGKIISELLAINYGRTHFSRVLVARPHNVYGPDMGFEHVIPEFARRVADGVRAHGADHPLPFPIQGDGTQTRAFIYIDDFIAALVAVLQHGEHLGIYHLGNDHESSIAEVARLVATSMGAQIELQGGPPPPGGTLRRCPDIGKIRALGFEPRFSLDEGIERYVQWFSKWEETLLGTSQRKAPS